MKRFDTFALDAKALETEMAEFGSILQRPDGFAQEAKQIAPFFRARRNLSSLLGLLVSGTDGISRVDRLAFELGLFGDFACDLALGDSDRRRFLFVEFEDATENSIFERVGKKVSRDWSKRYSHGFGQIVDWSWQIESHRNTPQYRELFQCEREVHPTFLLLMGRDAHLNENEKERLRYRNQHVLVRSERVLCFTFDSIHEFLRTKLDSIRQLT